MDLNGQLWKALTERNAAKATQIMNKKPWLGETANLNQINLGPQGLHPIIHWIELLDVEWVKWAIKHGADLNVQDTKDRLHRHTKGSTPLTTAIRRTLFDHTVAPDIPKGIHIVESLLAAGADVNLSGRDGATPLHYAVHIGHGKADADSQAQLFSLLLKAGANPSASDSKGSTPLHYIFIQPIIYEGELEAAWVCVKMLLQAGASVNARDDRGETPLHRAAGSPDKDVMTLAMRLHQTEALDLDAQNNYGHTPLHIASANSRIEAVRLLLAAGADKHIRDNEGQPALDETREHFKSDG
jgi:ankyrin repeat protein